MNYFYKEVIKSILYILVFTQINVILCFINDIGYHSIGFWELGENLNDSSLMKNDIIFNSNVYEKPDTTEGIFGNENGAIDFSQKDYNLHINALDVYKF